MRFTGLIIKTLSVGIAFVTFILRTPNGIRAGQLNFIATSDPVELPFKLHDGYLIVVEGRIGTREHLKFALDTAATHSVLRADLAEGLGIATHSTRIVNMDRVVRQELSDISDLQLGPLRLSTLPMMLSSLSYLRSTGVSVDALIGLDVLRLRSFTIDFDHHKIIFGACAGLNSSAALKSAEAYWAVEVLMMHQPVRLVLDTGVPSILLYRDRLGDRLPNLPVERAIRGASFGGAASLQVVTLPPVQLSGKELDRHAVLLEHSPQGVLPRMDGYLSVMALGARRLSVDVEKNLMSWE